ncbi:HxlR family transcriptional regulator [Actinoplanes cyaneus]|uniref:HxlR family transcriptional regulator n=1 Tax=Actinoplanes cyaneus TaxID=52696 RepID=A0A919M8X9_9ACTN|nr:transcriptional regulator, HxlR family [Actinoplanes cyaneus]GID68873.1 HxlR family transcriptional regulator [Actinoplanes cyaneus]
MLGSVGTRQEIGALPPEADLARADSLARSIFSEVANKWSLLIIEFLGQRTMRFNELRREVGGISHKVLTQNLRTLERNGLVERTVHPTVPPSVEYSLTEAGDALRDVVDGMCGWTQTFLEQIEASRARFADDQPGSVS